MADLSNTGITFETRPIKYIEFALQQLGMETQLNGPPGVPTLQGHLGEGHSITIEIFPHGETYDMLRVTEKNDKQVWRRGGKIGNLQYDDIMGRFRTEISPASFIKMAIETGLIQSLEEKAHLTRGFLLEALNKIPLRGLEKEPDAAQPTHLHADDGYDYDLGM